MEIDVKLKPTKENIEWFNSVVDANKQELSKEAETAKAVLAKTKDSVLSSFLNRVIMDSEVE